MVNLSAGILLYRRVQELEVFIAHMGGPLWSRKDAAAWSIPKGLLEPGETPLQNAIREFTEEIGTRPPDADYTHLGDFRLSSSKTLAVFIAETDFELVEVNSNLFTIEWPPRSGRMQEFPEMDDARWFPIDIAREKLVKGQLPVLDALQAAL